jgi:hypothetical protein
MLLFVAGKLYAETRMPRKPKRSPNTVLVAPTIEPKPLEIQYFDRNADSFSSEVMREHQRSPFYRPDIDEHGKPTDNYLLTVASVVLSAADREIRFAYSRIEILENRLGWWNRQLFQPMPTTDVSQVDDKGNIAKAETAWFAKYLTLGTLLSATAVVSAAIWTIFVWYSGEKKTDVDYWKGLYQAATAQVAQIEHSRSESESHYKFIEDHASAQSNEATRLNNTILTLTKEAGEAKTKTAVAQEALKEANKTIEQLKAAKPPP